MARLAFALVAALCMASGAAAASRPEFDIPSISTINTTAAMQYVHSYAKAMQAIVPVSRSRPPGPPARQPEPRQHEPTGSAAL